MSTFAELGIKPEFVQALTEMGIVTPTPIQMEAIPLMMEGAVDMVGQAQTGTGKTAAYGLPLLQRINPTKGVVQGLILCPTRELGQQVAKQLFKFTKYCPKKIFTEAVYGGAHIQDQINALKRPTHIVVATPGRLIDLINKKAVDLSNVKTVILDEADEMLTMGFKNELEEILRHVAGAKSKWLFSATIPHGIKAIVNSHMKDDAYRVTTSKKDVVNKNIEHKYLVCDDRDKFNVLLQFLQSEKDERGIIFCRTKVATKRLAEQLTAKGIGVAAIHGDLKQLERDKALRGFKNENLRVLVATDVAARGLDIEDLAFVVHFELPDKDEYYTHRSGRTARAGKRGTSLCLVNTKELKSIKYLEKNLGIGFKQVRQVK